MAKDIRVTLELDNSKFNRAINQSKGQVKGFETSSTKSVGNIRNAFIALGGAAVIKSIATVGSSFQDLQNSLNVVFGGIDEGAAAFGRVQDFAASTQFSVETLTGAFVQLKGAGVEPTEELLQTFADTASVTTDQMGTFQAALDLVSRSTAGGLGLEDLNRLADRGIPVFNILQERLGLTRLEVSNFGKTAEGANTIVRELLNGLNQRFGGALQEQVGLLNFELNQLGDAFDKLQVAIFGIFAEDAASGVTSLTGAINRLAESVEGFAESGGAQTFLDLGQAIGITAISFLGLKGVPTLLTGIGNTIMKLRGPSALLGILGTTAAGLAPSFTAIFTNIGRAFTALKIGSITGALSSLLFSLKAVLGFALRFAGLVGVFIGVAQVVDVLVESLTGFSIIDGVLGMLKSAAQSFGFFKDTVEEVAEVVEEETEDLKANAKAAAEAQRQKDLATLAEESFAKGLRDSTNAIKEQTGAFDKNDPLSSYMELLSDVLKTANDTAVQQIFAGKAISAVTDQYENGLIPLRTYNLAIEQLKNMTGETPFADFIDGLDNITLTTEEYAEKQRQLNALIEKYPHLAEEAAKAQDELDEALSENEGLTSFLDTLGQAQKRLSQDLATALIEGKSASESFKDFFKTLVTQLIADALRLAIIQPILSSLFGISFGAGGVVDGLTGGGLLGSLGFAANGGPIMKNKPYIVGERGPELMIPGQSGTMIPNSMLGGGGTTNVNYTINAVDTDSFRNLVARDPEFIYSVTRAGRRRLPGN